MATKEELNRIFEQALLEEEVVFKNPLPATSPAPAISASMPVPGPLLEPVMEQPRTAVAGDISTKPADHVSVNETDPEFGALLEEREGRLKRSRSRARWVVNLMLLGIFGGTAVAFAVSPTLHRKLDYLVKSLHEGVDDVKMMGKGTENYDEALGKVAVRGDQIDEATRALGVDPTAVDPGDDPNMRAEMNAFAGEDMGMDTRLGKLKTMGTISQSITGAQAPKTKAEIAK